ncbi:MAG: WxL domain-containing protein [Solirubrobacteraceae bacterium]|nr:WxL domain-containing protein [Patulibacter sp.]
MWWLRQLGPWGLCLAVAATLSAVLPDRARAAVGFRAASCGQSSNVSTLTLAVPAGTKVGDLLVATVGVGKPPLADPAGWTPVPGLRGTVHSEQELVTWYRFASAPVPASYTFTGTGSPDALAGGIVAFSGVSTTSPISGTPAQTIQSSLTTSDVLPNSTGAVAGSMRYSAVGSDDMTTAAYPAAMTMSCNEPNGTGVDISTSIAWESTGAGTTATRTVTRNDNARSVLHTLVLNPVPCGAGGLDIAIPSTLDFPATVLSGLDQTRAAVINLDVNDQTGSGAGWNVTATSTTFRSGSFSLPTSAASITGASPVASSGNCVMPTNGIAYPVTVPAGSTAPTAAKVFNAAASTGAGPVDLDLSVSLAIPASARVGTYVSTWTITLVAGP